MAKKTESKLKPVAREQVGEMKNRAIIDKGRAINKAKSAQPVKRK